jgi:hypothetical protein
MESNRESNTVVVFLRERKQGAGQYERRCSVE